MEDEKSARISRVRRHPGRAFWLNWHHKVSVKIGQQRDEHRSLKVMTSLPESSEEAD